MTAHYEVRGTAALITLDNPPVNALGHGTRKALWEGLQRALADAAVQAIVITGAGRAFSGGADIREFDTPESLAEPNLRTIVEAIDIAPKPVIAAVHSLALGGGNELALACHYRVGAGGAQIGLPEVKLGVLPGAGGTQRLPRLVGAAAALEMIVSGAPRRAEELAKLGYFDRLVAADELLDAALALAREVGASCVRPPRLTERSVPPESLPGGADAFFAAARSKVAADARGQPAPLRCVDAVEAAVRRPFAEGLQTEGAIFVELVGTIESKALRHAFFAERTAARIPDVPEDTPVRPIRRAAVIGAGLMGGGIAMCFANAGIPVTVLDVNEAALERGLATVRRSYQASVERGRMSPEELQQRMALIAPALSYEALGEADILIEAVFEDLALKERVFRALDAAARPGAILATNTSMLDVNRLAAATRRPADVIGTHFFSPANVMRLLEIVRGAATSKVVLATTLQLAKRLGKVGVVAGVCDGFIGNRMVEPYARQAGLLVEEGALPKQVDAALERFGMAMGPFRMLDLAGLDTHMRVLERHYLEYPQWRYPRWIDRVHALGRFGQKSGVGIYRYERGNRSAVPDPAIETLIADHARELGIERRAVPDEEIVERCIFALVNEGARILEEGIASRASDIDVVYLTGYGFPAHRGGPMFHADTVGLPRVVAAMQRFAANPQADAAFWEPAPLLARLAARGGRLLEARRT